MTINNFPIDETWTCKKAIRSDIETALMLREINREDGAVIPDWTEDEIKEYILGRK